MSATDDRATTGDGATITVTVTGGAVRPTTYDSTDGEAIPTAVEAGPRPGRPTWTPRSRSDP